MKKLYPFFVSPAEVAPTPFRRVVVLPKAAQGTQWFLLNGETYHLLEATVQAGESPEMTVRQMLAPHLASVPPLYCPAVMISDPSERNAPCWLYEVHLDLAPELPHFGEVGGWHTPEEVATLPLASSHIKIIHYFLFRQHS